MGHMERDLASPRLEEMSATLLVWFLVYPIPSSHPPPLQPCFPCAIQDKMLRVMLYDHIVNDIKSINEKGRNPKVCPCVPFPVYMC